MSDGFKKDKNRFMNEALPHADSLYRMALRTCGDTHLAQDLVQDTYKEAWQSFGSYQPNTNCKAWLYKILLRIVQRQTKKSRRFSSVRLDQVAERQLLVVATAEERLEREEILQIVAGIPEKYRTILLMADVENVTYKEIAETLEIPIGTVMSRLNRARGLLRERFHGLSGKTRTA